jgi:glyoxylate reductase
MPRPSLLITRRIPSSVLARLEAVCDVDLFRGEGAITHDELLARVAGKEALMCLLTDQVDREVIAAGSKLRVIANVAVGYNNIDLAAARERGIHVTNTPEVLTESVAEFTWAAILATMRRLSEGERVVRAGQWKGWALDLMLGSDLAGKQLGIVGMGRIGRAVAVKAPAFGMTVVYASRGSVEMNGAERRTLDHLLSTSDVVTLHVPLTTETRHMIDQRALLRMKRTAYLVNTSRGPVVDEAALAWALRERLIAGAALDVYEHEPAIHPELLELENVLLIPHLGSATTETRTAMADLAARNVLAVLGGGAPLTEVPESLR